MKFLIKDITRRTGETRTDSKYTNRIGSVIEFLKPVQVGEIAPFKYVKYNNGEQPEQCHLTQISRVDDIEWYEDKFYIYTRNSIYKLIPVNDEETCKKNTKQKIIFLDVDGVLNGYDSLRLLGWNIACKLHIQDWYRKHTRKPFSIHEEKVKRLAKIIKATDAKVVLSSSWRHEFRRTPYEDKKGDLKLFSDLLDFLKVFPL